jgi:hypothetical protein
MMGFFKFSAVLNREITEEEFAILQEAGCAGGTLSTSVLPVSDNTVVTQIDFDKAEAETLYDAMLRVLDALTKVPKLSAFSLDVPEPSVGQAPAATESSQAEPERIPGDSTLVTAEIETTAEPVDAAANGAGSIEAVAAPVAAAPNATAPNATAPNATAPDGTAAPDGTPAPDGTAAADLESANHNGAANGTALTGDDEAAAAAEPRFVASQLV